MPEPILLYRASKCKQTKEQGSEDCLWSHIFTFYQIIVTFFLMLEPILLYRASKCKQTKEQGSEDCLWSHIFTLYKIVTFFSFLCQDANKTRPNCAIIGCNLSKKHKLTLYKTQNGKSNYADHKFFFNFY